MTEAELKRRTKQLALQTIDFVENLRKTQASHIIGRQLLRSGTSVGANYRTACRAKSLPDFVAKLAISEEECDESLYWIELLLEARLTTDRVAAPLLKEGNELLAIFVASIRTARSRIPVSRSLNSRSADTLQKNQRASSPIQNPKSKT